MRKLYFILLALILSHLAVAQSSAINRQQFFLDDRVIEATITTDIKNLRSKKKVPVYQPANIVMRFSDTSIVSEEIRIQPRGEFRKINCDIASLMLHFKNPSSPNLSPLKKLKLVGGCGSNSVDEEYLLKEYIIYKIYNFITNMSFRVRLLHITYKDSKQKMKTYTQYAFLIEDMNDMAERNNCKEIKKKIYNPEAINRAEMILVSVFQYMIGNTDWSLANYHNVKIMVSKNDTLSRPYVVPYDFDYTGIVDAPYAIPAEQFGNTTVKERVYRGGPRGIGEVTEALQVFKDAKERIMFYINDFALLNTKTRRSVISYLEEFYSTIGSKNSMRSVFNAR
ncbi:MAG: hypothetical protein ACR2KX_11925 [Chitinophagaceae bacterium]